MSWLRPLCLGIAVAFAMPGCTCNKSPEQPSRISADDTSLLGQFRKKRRTVRKRKKRKPSNPPTREDGLLALEEAKYLIEEADFREAELELKIAAAAGTAGADALLYRVRNEISAEDHILEAQKQASLLNFEGARGHLEQVPPGLILSDIAQEMIEGLSERESEKRKVMLEKATQRFEGEEDGGEEPPEDEPAPDEPEEDEE